MKTVDIYEIGEEVYIRARVDDIIIENGEPKYKVSPEAAAESLAHKYSHTELKPVPVPKKSTEGENEESVDINKALGQMACKS